MITFFGNPSEKVFAVQTEELLSTDTLSKLNWLFGGVQTVDVKKIEGDFIGPRAAMITPWSTNAVEISQNMGIEGIIRIEEFDRTINSDKSFDPMLQNKFNGLSQDLFTIKVEPEKVLEIQDISIYNQKEGLALNEDEILYLNNLSDKLGRKLTDSEVFGFSQVNSEHCRHKIFNGTFVIDGEKKPNSLFKLIKKTSQINPNTIVSAYSDNVAFTEGPKIEQFAPKTPNKPDFFQKSEINSVISLKAETHNFPTTVEPFNGAATGSGGEIRDRLAGGKGSLPLAGTAVYMTSYSRLNENRPWEKGMEERKWLYQTPMDILIKASNGASDFGNKFGQPLITGSLLTFEHEEDSRKLGFDKVIMQAGGIGYGRKEEALKDIPNTTDKVVLLGGENYRIGMGGAAVSSADTGEFSSGIELNAIQRSNPEMQKRAMNAIRGMIESGKNPIISIHDHGAGGHLNCLSELVEVENKGGRIELDALPVGDPTLSAKEIIGNESQERMGLVIKQEHLSELKEVAERERSPMYTVGEVTGDGKFTFESSTTGEKPMDLELNDMFGSSPKTVMTDKTVQRDYQELEYNIDKVLEYTGAVLKLESVACKDWLTNKVDRCVTGKVAKQQCAGPLQLPLNNVGVMALDYNGKEGIANSIGHSPVAGIIDPVAGSKNAIAEALTNIVWAPLQDKLKSVSLSANWMWPCKNKGEDARLYEAVQAVSDFAINLGINVPTGKDSLSMKQKYKDMEVISPGTVVISAAGHCDDIKKVVEPVLVKKEGNKIFHINLSSDNFKLGGSSFGQILNKLGNDAPSIQDDVLFAKSFDAVQDLIKKELISAGHDVSAGGLITALLEMCFADNKLGVEVDLTALDESDSIKVLFAENAGLVFQSLNPKAVEQVLQNANVPYNIIGQAVESDFVKVKNGTWNNNFHISQLRDIWYETSYLLDKKQSGDTQATLRFDNYKKQTLNFKFHQEFSGKKPNYTDKRPIAAVLREKGSNSEREMANALFLAGFNVKDVHMTDLISGREDLTGVQMIAAVGGFSNSDVLGSAKGWAGAFLYNEKANKALNNFFSRDDTLSLGVCNGCQLFIELGLINPDHEEKPKMLHNDSHKFECNFTSVSIQENNSVMLGSLAGNTLGIWAAHGEGKFHLPYNEQEYNIVGKYGYNAYPANPNGSDYNTAIMTSTNGRHLVMMPHCERSIFPWNWGNYPSDRKDQVTPWLEAFENARKWCLENN
ncbi:MAG: phosphoribosylformylglycinamidine synthase [Flavobacteriales bacterium]|nr:phosphoribosylformylglycinamidine synthase [Flavobacteriales bacterium]